jgi:PAS domain S-box-containing protein
MFGLDPGILGALLIISALIITGVSLLISRRISRASQVTHSMVALPVDNPLVTTKEDAVIVIQIGGRIIHLNDIAREWFGYKEKNPNLERLARRVKPDEVFLGLCSTEGQVRFSFNGHLYEGTSYYIPMTSDTTEVMLISIRRLLLTGKLEDRASDSIKTLGIITELNQAMTATLGLDQTLQAILEGVEELIPSDFARISVWDEIEQHLITYLLSETKDVERQLEKINGSDLIGRGFSGYLISSHQPLLISNLENYNKAHPELPHQISQINSYLGIPLLHTGQLVGTLELASFSLDAFHENDVGLMNLISGQAAIALRNSLLFQDMQNRVAELTGLLKLTQASEARWNTQEFYTRLIEGISPLMQVESIGFLVYDEVRRRLVAQKPFVGLPPDFIDLFQVTLPPGSEGEAIWLAKQMIVANPAPEDERIVTLGMAGLLQAAGLIDVALLPLTSGERILGYLQVADKLDGSLFNPQDLHKLTIISGQAATVIENLILVNQSQERALRSEALRRIASLTGSIATMDEILTFSLRELAYLLRADIAAILLVDESRAELRVHPASLFGIAPGIAARLGRVSMNVPEYQSTVTSSQHPILCDDISKEALLPPMYRLMSDVLGLRAFINVPILVRERGIGEIILGSPNREFFDPSDLILLMTTASQIAAAIEKSSLYTQTDESLQRRVEQLTALTRISRELNTNLELRTLLQLVHAESLRTTRASCGTISLYGQLEESSGECRAFIRVGDDREGILSPIEAKVMAFEEPIVVSNYDLPILSIGNTQEAPPHPGVVSSLIVPIPYQEGIAGLIHLHSNHADHFDTTAVEIAQTLATQAAIALGNASRYYDQHQRSELLSRRVETIEKVMETARSLSPKQSLEVSLEAIAFGIQESTPFNVVIIDVYHPVTRDLRQIAAVGLPLDTIEQSRSITLPWSSIVDALPDENNYNGIYFIPIDGAPYQPNESTHTSDVLLETFLRAGEKSWTPGDELFIILNDQLGNPLGLMRMDLPRDGKRPDRPTMESLAIFASQACFVIEAHQKMFEMESKINAFQSELARAQMVIDASQTSQPIFLQKDLENAIDIRNLSQRSRRIQIGLDIAELVNRQTSRKDVLYVFGQEALTWLNLNMVLIAETREGNPHLVHTFGIPPSPNLRIETYLGQRNPLKTTLQNKELVLVENLDENQNWNGTPLLNALGTKSFICLPIVGSGFIDSAVLMISQVYMPPFTEEDVNLFELLCRQVGMTLENLRLLDETNRRLHELNLLLEFSRQVGSLDPLNILRSLADSALKAVPNAHAGMVLLWQEDQECLAPQVASGYSHNERMLDIKFRTGEALPGRIFASGEALRVDEVIFTYDYNLPPEYLLVYRDATEGKLPISSLAVPIQTSENKLGVVILDNFRETAVFTQDDLDLVTSLTRQTALTLENARLYQSAEQRAVQLMALTNVAATITSSLKTNELINSLLGQVSSIISFDTATLWLRQGDHLTVKAASGFEDSDQRFGLSVAIEDSLLLKEMIETSRPILVKDVRQDVRFPTLLEPHYLTWLGVPLISKGEVVGVIALEKVEANYYTHENIDALVTFAGQAAVALENAKLYEESIRKAVELNEHSQHLTLLNRLSTELSGSLDLEYILGLTLLELAQAVHSDLISVILFDSSARPYLQAEEPRILDEYPMQLPESPIFERLHETLGIFSTDNVSVEEELGSLLDFLTARSTRSLLILPLAIGDDLHGLLLAHANQPYLFEADEVELARTISNQAAVAIQNALLFQETERLFSETQKRSAELGVLFELGVNITQVLDQNPLIEATFTNVTRLLGADACGLVLVSPDDTLELRALDRDDLIGPIHITRSGTSFSEYVLKTGEPLFIRDIELEKAILPVQGYTLGEQVKTWLGVPLMVRGVTMGVLSVQSYRANAFGETELRLLGQVGNQLAVALDNARLFENAQVYAADMAQRVSERTRELEKEHNRSQTLLRIITELSASLDQDMVLNRTLTILNETIKAQYSLIVLVHPEKRELYLRSTLEDVGFRTRRKHKTGWKLSEGLASWVVAECQPVLIPDLLDDDRWAQPKDEQFVYRSGIAVPLIMGEESLGALLMYHHQIKHFNQDMLELAQTAAKQIAVSINNTQLFNLIRDQAERLGELLRNQHVETSRSQAMLEAVADGVLVTDARMAITLFNASAEKILRLDRKQVLGQSLENFIGLFGKAAHDWVEIIKLWSENSGSYKPGESKSEQIELDDRRVVSVHLSPVLLRKDFLGTVSIFQDITHMVELDRLKSEFVATVSHELRTPMTSIKGYVEILLMGAAGALNDSQLHFLQVVRANTERLAILVNDLLDISRIEAGRVTLSMQPLNVKGIIQNSLDIITRRSIDEGKPMKIEVLAAPELPSAYGDRERVQQILDNLVQNAYQYTPEAGNIIIRADVVGDMMQFSVQDNGIGVVHDDQSRVFERFFRGEDPLVLATSGTGLGLSIVKHLVEMHGGNIWFESQGVPGLGSVFSFTIPLYEDAKTGIQTPFEQVDAGG